MAKAHEKAFFTILTVLSFSCAVAWLFLAGARFGAVFFFCFGAGSLALAVAAARSKRSAFARLVLRAGRVVLVCWLISLVIAECFIISGEKTDPRAQDAPCIIVLGTGVNGYTPSLCMVSRLEAAKELLDKNPDAVAILSGGQGEGEYITEAQAMYTWLTDRGTDPGRLCLEDASRNTLQNIEYSKALMEQKGLSSDEGAAIVTNEFHLRRSCRIAELNGIKAYGVCAQTPYTYLKIVYHIREYFSVAGLFITGRLF